MANPKLQVNCTVTLIATGQVLSAEQIKKFLSSRQLDGIAVLMDALESGSLSCSATRKSGSGNLSCSVQGKVDLADSHSTQRTAKEKAVPDNAGKALGV